MTPRPPSSVRRPTRLISFVLMLSVTLAAVVALAGPAAAAVETTDLTTEGVTAEDLAGRLVGDGITVSNAVFSGHDSAAGVFLGGNGILGLDSGVVLSSGAIANVIGPNDQTGAGSNFGGSGDADLTALAGTGTQDAAVLTFDFVPTTSTVQFSYVFSSEEYTEFIGLGFNDAFGFFVNGTNCALAGDPAVPITIDTINPGTNGNLFIDNETNPTLDTQMDGLTVVLTCTASVTPDDTNTMKLAIADAGDANLDSAVFLGEGTFAAVQPLTVTVDGDGAGTVTSVPAGIECGADCTEGYDEGTPVSLTAVADAGSTFTGWSGACEGTGTCDLTMSGPQSVTATFAADPDPCAVETDCDAGTVPPGGSLSTVEGTGGNPVTTGDPFALQLKNVTGDQLTGTIVEEACDGTQEGDPLCASPRVGGSAGNFQFASGGGSLAVTTSTTPAPVTVAKLFYDRSVVRVGAPVKIFYQKQPGDPVIRLQRCGDGVRTECFTLNKLRSGDQIVRVPLSADPRVTRG